MLRSMIIGLAIAALLQVGVETVAPAAGISLASQRIDWVTMQANTLSHVLDHGFTLLMR